MHRLTNCKHPVSLYSPAYSAWRWHQAMQMEQTPHLAWWQWPMALMQAFFAVIRKGPTLATEGGMAILVFVIGVWFLLPFDTLTSTGGLRELLKAGTEVQWGWAMIALSLFKASALGLLWLFPDSRAARVAQLVAAALILGLWVVIAVLLGSYNWRGLSFPIFGAFVLAQLWIFVGQGHDEDDAD